jgi:hypothetical protein
MFTRPAAGILPRRVRATEGQKWGFGTSPERNREALPWKVGKRRRSPLKLRRFLQMKTQLLHFIAITGLYKVSIDKPSWRV